MTKYTPISRQSIQTIGANFDRAITTDLENWLINPQRKPLILRGARQVGKSTLVKIFASKMERRLIELNLEKKPKIAKIFEQIDAERILKDIEIELDIQINPKKDLFFIDEIQVSPKALTSLRYFKEDISQLPVIAAGSLLDFALTQESISMPVGRISFAFVNPMTFEEFLEATEKTKLLNELKTFEWGKHLSETVHSHLLEQVELYLKLGGMPEVLQTFLASSDFTEARTIQEDILSTYREDFSKYASGKDLLLLQRLFDSFAGILGNKVKYAQLSRDESARDIRRALDLLVQARVLARVPHSNCGGLPLALEQSDTVYKLYHLDVGLMNAQLGTPAGGRHQSPAILTQLLGIQAEQMIYQNLRAQQRKQDSKIYYWLRERKTQNAELDFVLENEGQMLPIEVKSGAAGSMRSLFQFIAKTQVKKALRFDLNLPSIQDIKTEVITSSEKQSIKFKLYSLPLYLVGQYARLIGNAV